jgi:hypothetical protein
MSNIFDFVLSGVVSCGVDCVVAYSACCAGIVAKLSESSQ